MRISFLVRSLDYGGAERQLVALAIGLKARGEDVRVIALYGGGLLTTRLQHAGVDVVDVGKRGRWDVLGFAARLIVSLRRLRPDILYSFLPVQNLIAGLVRPTIRSTRVVWGVRASTFDLSTYDWLSRQSYLMQHRLSFLPDLVIVNSQAGWNNLTACGYPASKIRRISNGIDCAYFRRDREAGLGVRRKWGVADGDRVVGIVARFDPLKDIETFVRAAALLAAGRSDLRFVCVGDGPIAMADDLQALARRLGLGKSLVWAGARHDMPAVYSALDLLGSSSISEGFPNVVGEAMACGVPCVVTDVGDSAHVVEDTGVVVPPRDARAFSDGLYRLLAMTSEEHDDLAVRARARIQADFSVDALCTETSRVLADLAA